MSAAWHHLIGARRSRRFTVRRRKTLEIYTQFSFRELKRPEGRAPYAHFAPVFGACLLQLDVSRETAARIFFFNHLRGVLAAAVRLNIVGPMEAQMLLQRLSAKAEEVLTCCAHLTLDDIAQTAPLLDLWQGAQDRLYSRLFQS